MINDIDETCGECHWFVEKASFTCCHYNPPQFQLTTAFNEEDTGRRSWWTFPFVKPDELGCSYFEPRWRR